jgi:RNA-directed DNA polymerase
VDLDLEKFFDRVQHDVLMVRVARRVKDQRVLALIGRFLRAGMMPNGVCVRREEGTPQGGPLSPLLANILLDDLDKELEKRGHWFCRYADDCNIYVKSEAAGQRVMASVTEFLEKQLKLKVNRQKSAVGQVRERKFLGYRLLEGGTLGVAPQSQEKLFSELQMIFSWGLFTGLGVRFQKGQHPGTMLLLVAGVEIGVVRLAGLDHPPEDFQQTLA